MSLLLVLMREQNPFLIPGCFALRSEIRKKYTYFK